MTSRCGARGCIFPIPSALEVDGLCVLHFAQKVEDTCHELRRETAAGVSASRREEIGGEIAGYGTRLIQVSTGGERLSDELKMRLLNTFLALMNLRENVDRAAAARTHKP